MRDNIEAAFKSMIKSGRPDILDEDNNDLLPQLYVDLIDGDYFLKQALDENHVIFKGRKGTGKSTIFLQAENRILQNKSMLVVYINLQSCYEEIRPANMMENNSKLNLYNIYLKFFNQILQRIEEKCNSIFKDRNIDKLFKEIHEGEYIDAEFQRTMQITTNNTNSKSLNISANADKTSIDFVKRTIKKRISVYTSGQLDADELFNTQKEDIETYYKTLFYASAGIPRCLGYILTYSYLNSINKGNTITLQDINNASKTYFNENILVDFYNDTRYKQSFFDDNKILTQLTQKKLMDDLIEIAKTFKRQIIFKYTKNEKLKDLYIETIEKYKNGISFWIPSSHFYVEKDIETILQTLELYYIVSKFNEGSSRKKPGMKISYYGLNYGLCLENNIDYGKPELRRAYDYWRQDEFNYTTFIPAALNAVEVPICSNCGYKYDDKNEYSIAKKFGYCLSCKAEQSINSTNQLKEILATEIAKWKSDSLPDIEIDILRVLYNSRTTMTAAEIGSLVERHHLGVTKIMNKLKRKDYISYDVHEKRYYKITQKSIDTFFSS